MTDFSPDAVQAHLLRELEQGIDRIEALARRDWPVRLECSRLRGFVAALRKEHLPLDTDADRRMEELRAAQPVESHAKVVPMRKLALVGRVFDLVQESGRPPDRSIESSYLNREPEPDPACLAEQEVDDAG